MCNLCDNPEVDITVDGIKMCKNCYEFPQTEPTCGTCGLALSDCDCSNADIPDIGGQFVDED